MQNNIPNKEIVFIERREKDNVIVNQIGFVMEEKEDFIKIASTKGGSDYKELSKIKKEDIIKMSRIEV